MIVESTVQQETIEAKQIRAYIEGCEERTMELRGYGLTTTERAEVEAEAHELYAS
jgi:hypothetical protein